MGRYEITLQVISRTEKPIMKRKDHKDYQPEVTRVENAAKSKARDKSKEALESKTIKDSAGEVQEELTPIRHSAGRAHNI